MFITLTTNTIIAYNDDFVKLKSLEMSRLDLANYLQEFWQSLKIESKVCAILDESAGFTNTRMLYIWLQSYKMFSGGDFVILNGNCTNLQEFELIKNQTEAKLFQKPANIG